jgi:hypothetical protein
MRQFALFGSYRHPSAGNRQNSKVSAECSNHSGTDATLVEIQKMTKAQTVIPFCRQEARTKYRAKMAAM